MERIIQRFLRYIAIDTKANPNAESTPSSAGQLELGKILCQELEEMGASEIMQDEHGYVYAKVPATSKELEKASKIGFLAHLDTSPEIDGKCDNPQFIQYTGGDIKLNDKFTMKLEDFPNLKKHIGKELIVTDGNCLLGADDKAGLAIAMETLAEILENSNFEHGQISFCACPDEEIGHGASLMDLERFGADYAFTIDGGAVGEMEYESFNAASAHLHFQGQSVHPGSAKDKMLNASDLICAFHQLLPEQAKPQYTEGYEGFFMLEEIKAGVDEGECSYIIRDHSREAFEAKKDLMRSAVQFFNQKYASEIISLEIKDSYYNMKDKLMDHLDIVEDLKQAMINCGITPKIAPVRGGTDGSQLSWRGLPCPNFFAGGENFHGRYEFVPREALGKAKEVALELISITAKKI